MQGSSLFTLSAWTSRDDHHSTFLGPQVTWSLEFGTSICSGTDDSGTRGLTFCYKRRTQVAACLQNIWTPRCKWRANQIDKQILELIIQPLQSKLAWDRPDRRTLFGCSLYARREQFRTDSFCRKTIQFLSFMIRDPLSLLDIGHLAFYCRGKWVSEDLRPCKRSCSVDGSGAECAEAVHVVFFFPQGQLRSSCLCNARLFISGTTVFADGNSDQTWNLACSGHLQEAAGILIRHERSC